MIFKENALLFKSEKRGCVRNGFILYQAIFDLLVMMKTIRTPRHFRRVADCKTTQTRKQTRPQLPPLQRKPQSAGCCFAKLKGFGKIMSSSLWPQGTAGNYHDPCSCSAGTHFPLRFCGTEKEDLRRVQAFFSSDIWIQGGPDIQTTRRLLNKATYAYRFDESGSRTKRMSLKLNVEVLTPT